MIRTATSADAGDIAEIYNHFILHTVVTFEEEAVPDHEMERRISETQKKFPWLVYEENGKVLGYAYASPWKQRAAYRFATECTVYLNPDHTGKGLGSKLYQALFDQLEQMDVHCVIGGVALPNDASVTLHEKFAFNKVAHFKEVGYKFGKWIDVAYWEKIFKK